MGVRFVPRADANGMCTWKPPEQRLAGPAWSMVAAVDESPPPSRPPLCYCGGTVSCGSNRGWFQGFTPPPPPPGSPTRHR